MHGVVASKAEVLDHSARVPYELLGDFHHVELSVEDFERIDGNAKFLGVNSLHAKGHGQGSSTPRIGEPRGDHPFGFIPESRGGLAGGLLNEEFEGRWVSKCPVEAVA